MYQSQRKNVQNVCKQHGEPISSFCRTCQLNACSTCVSTIHRRHFLIDYRNLHTELQSNLDSLLKEKEGEQIQMTRNLDALEECANQCRGTLNQNLVTIDDRMKALHIAVDEEGHLLKKALKRTADKTIAKAEERKQMLEANRNVYDQEIQTVRYELAYQTPSTFNRLKANNSKLCSLEHKVFTIPKIDTFNAGRIDKDAIRGMIGTHSKQEASSGSPGDIRNRGKCIITNLEILTRSDMDGDDFHSICASPDGTIWIGGEKYVYKMSSDCSTKFCCIELDASCRHLACLKSDDAIVSQGRSSLHYNCQSNIYYVFSNNVKKLTSDGRMGLFFDDESYSNENKPSDDRFMYDINVTIHNEVVFAAAEKGVSPKYYLDMFSAEGLYYRTITSPKAIGSFCINQDGNFVISDAGSTCLTILDGHGKVMKETQISKPNLQRMTCDGYGNILGVSGDRKEVNLFSEDGRIERSFTVECEEYINDICTGRDDRLYILVDKKEVIIAKYMK